jgi:hypothetical protein
MKWFSFIYCAAFMSSGTWLPHFHCANMHSIRQTELATSCHSSKGFQSSCLIRQKLCVCYADLSAHVLAPALEIDVALCSVTEWSLSTVIVHVHKRQIHTSPES